MTDAALWARALTVAGALFLGYLFVMWVAMIFWTRRDVRARTGGGVPEAGAVLLVALGNLPGLLLYLALRPPETHAELLSRSLEEAALAQEIDRKQACPGCGAGIAPDFAVCPQCRAPVQAPCVSCTRTLRASWVLCPYCGADRPERAAEAGGAAAASRRQPQMASEEMFQPVGAQRPVLQPTKA